MKEVLRKIVTILMVMMLVINSSAILVISEAVDEIQSLTNSALKRGSSVNVSSGK